MHSAVKAPTTAIEAIMIVAGPSSSALKAHHPAITAVAAARIPTVKRRIDKSAARTLGRIGAS